MRVLLVGSGGREHALAWKLKQSPKLTALYCAPGNPGISKIATCAPIDASDVKALVAFAQETRIDFVVVGPEVPLCLGLVDALKSVGIVAFGPHQEAAQLEGSKAYAKAFMERHGIPTAKYGRYDQVEAAMAALPAFGLPVVIKADGLAAGKGVVIAQTANEAVEALKEMLSGNRFGVAGHTVVIESFLKGIEASQLCLVDGQRIVPLESAQDYKRAFDGDLGPNTGGMGTYSPSRLYTPELLDRIRVKVMEPFLEGLKKDGISYCGLIFIGLMIEDGEPSVIEFNVRFGDPETQSLMVRLEGDLLDILWTTANGHLDEGLLKWSNETAVCVVLAAEGYPDSYVKHARIDGLEAFESEEKAWVFHAGTTTVDEVLVSSGGRVLNVVACGASMSKARDNAYRAMGHVKMPNSFYRGDIGE